MTNEQANLIATAIVNSILDKGLAVSTWRENHPSAHSELLEYRKDMIADATKLLKRIEVKYEAK